MSKWTPEEVEDIERGHHSSTNSLHLRDAVLCVSNPLRWRKREGCREVFGPLGFSGLPGARQQRTEQGLLRPERVENGRYSVHDGNPLIRCASAGTSSR